MNVSVCRVLHIVSGAYDSSQSTDIYWPIMVLVRLNSIDLTHTY